MSGTLSMLDTRAMGLLMKRVESLPDAGNKDWYLQLFVTAFDQTGSVAKSFRTADNLFKTHSAPKTFQEAIRILKDTEFTGSITDKSGHTIEFIGGQQLFEAGFTGTITDKLGHKIHYEDGKRVKAAAQEPEKAKIASPAETYAANETKRGEHNKQSKIALNAYESANEPTDKEVDDKMKAVGAGDHASEDLHPSLIKKQNVVMKAGIKLMHALEIAFPYGQQFAKQIAKENGCSDETAQTVKSIVQGVDLVFQWGVNWVVAQHLCHSAGIEGAALVGAEKASAMIPVGSIAFAALATAVNPFAAMAAARKVHSGVVEDHHTAIKDKSEKLKSREKAAADDEATFLSTTKPYYGAMESIFESVTEDAKKEFTNGLARRVDKIGDPKKRDYYLACVWAAVDYHRGDVTNVLKEADATFAKGIPKNL